MTLKIRKKDIWSFLAVFLIFLYSFTKAGIQQYVYPNILILYFSLGYVMISPFFFGGVPKTLLRNYTDILMLLCIAILLLNRNQNFANSEFEDGIVFVCIGVFFIFAKRSNNWHKFVVPVMSIWIAIHTLVTILEYALPGFYMERIFPLMPEYAWQHLNAVFKSGYMPGLAVHYSTNGMYLAVSLIVVGVLLMTGMHQKRKFKIIALLLVAIALLLTGKRALILFSVFALIATYYVYNSNKPIGRNGKILLLVIGISIAFFIGSCFIPALSNFIVRFIETAAEGDITLGRFDQYRMAFALFGENPVVGIGWDAFKYIYADKFGSLLNVHNIFIQVLCENGVLGALPFFAFFIAMLYRAMSGLSLLRRKYTNLYATAEFFLGLSVAMQMFFLMYGLTGNPLYDAQVFYPYIVCITAGEYYLYWYKKEVMKYSVNC